MTGVQTCALPIFEDDTERNTKTAEAMRKLNDTYLDMLCQMIEYIRVPEAIVMDKEHILDFLKNSDKLSYNKIRDYSLELKQQTDLQPLKIKCQNCGHEYDQVFTVNATDFFA